MVLEHFLKPLINIEKNIVWNYLIVQDHFVIV